MIKIIFNDGRDLSDSDIREKLRVFMESNNFKLLGGTIKGTLIIEDHFKRK